jgi:hypothetical protein
LVTSSSNYRKLDSVFSIGVTNLVNPYSTTTTPSFTFSVLDSLDQVYETLTTGKTITATAGAMLEGTAPTLTSSSAGVLDPTNLGFSLKAATFVDSPATAKLVITAPSGIGVTAGACTVTGVTGFAFASCSASGQVVIISDFTGNSLSALELFAFTVTNVFTNPASVSTSSAFVIQSMIGTGTVDSISNITITATVGTIGLPSPITNGVLPTSLTTGLSTTYTFEIYPPKNVAAGAVLTVVFPSEITLPSNTQTCATVQNIDNGIVCTVSSQTLTVSSGFAAERTYSGTQALKFTLSNVQNPRSATASSGFSFYIKTSGGVLIYNLLNSPTVTMTTI